ncbi:MAG: glycosyltransferase family 4 protein [Magnetococcales bacterium]|nr:glycosyltransferase family 4 protein [Magnetococcales bacterium]
MKILIVSQYFWPENFKINDLTRELIQSGHQVTVLTGLPNYPEGAIFDAFKQNPKAFSQWHGATILRVPLFPRGQNKISLIINYISFVITGCLMAPWLLRGQAFDVIFVFQLSPVTVGLPAILLAKLKRAPILFWVQDLWPETLSALGVVRSPALLGLVGKLVSFIYNRCELILGQSPGFESNIVQYCDDPGKIRYFPNWTEDVFTQNAITPAPEITTPPGTFNILFAGNVGEAQDFPAILDAAERLKDHPEIRWLIVGDGRMLEWVRRETVKRGLESSFLLLGRFPLERMPSFYIHADALLVALKRDPVFALTIPNKVQSYLMSGIPILGMLDGEGAAVIRAAGAGLTCPSGDGAGLVEAVLKLHALDAASRKVMGANGHAYAQKEFNRKTLIERLNGWMQQVVTKNRRTV